MTSRFGTRVPETLDITAELTPDTLHHLVDFLIAPFLSDGFLEILNPENVDFTPTAGAQKVTVRVNTMKMRRFGTLYMELRELFGL